LIAWLAARGFHERAISIERLGLSHHVTCWLTASIASFFVLGTWPAEIVSNRAQSWVIGTVAVLVTLGVPLWFCWFWRFRFSLRSVFKLTYCFSVLFAVLAWLRARTHEFDTFPPERWVPAMDLDSFTNLGVQYGVARHSWEEAAIQWLGYRGPFVTGLLGFGLVGACCAARAARVARKGGIPANPLSSQAFWAGYCAAISRCAWAPGLACLVAYLVIAPGYFESSDLQYARVVGHLRDPRQEWQAIRTAHSQ